MFCILAVICRLWEV